MTRATGQIYRSYLVPAGGRDALKFLWGERARAPLTRAEPGHGV